MFHKGTRVNTPQGFARVIAPLIVDAKVAFYSVELEKDSTRTTYSTRDISLSQETDSLIKEYLASLASVNEDSDEEVTKNTCPACHGMGHFEDRKETSTSYHITREACFLCDGATVVSATTYARYARMISKLV